MADLVQIIRSGLKLAVPLASVGGFPKVALLADVKAYNAAGGTFSYNAWRTRDLAEISDPDNIVSVSSNRFTPIAGNYLIEWRAPAIRVNEHVSRLYNYTTSTSVKAGSAEYAFSMDYSSTWSVGEHILTANGTDAYQIDHYCLSTYATTGFGDAHGISGADSIYTQVKLTKLS
jgi:hypothetical protein